MKIINDIKELNIDNTVIALGKFDGLHLGHMTLLNRLLDKQREGLTGVVFTFTNPPISILKGSDYKKIYSRDEKMNILDKLDVDIVVECPITKEFLSMRAEAFIEEILVKKMGVKHIIVGSDFRFGKGRQGNIDTLIKYSKEYDYIVDAVVKLEDKENIISSTRIRNCILEGNMEQVEELLGRPYSIYSEIIYGKQLGRTINIPTANQYIDIDKITPPYGVYLSQINIDGKVYNGISNLGKKPTVGEHIVGLETHIFDFNEDVYGKLIEVSLLKYIRPEKRFGSVEELVENISRDIETAKVMIK